MYWLLNSREIFMAFCKNSFQSYHLYTISLGKFLNLVSN
tara:strand:- start:412 stop:528 length:117 start_codon:yes stop_codon:yes gene_type:complete